MLRCHPSELNAHSAFLRRAGFSIIEVLIATAVIGIGLGALMTVNSRVLRIAKDTRETNAASLMLQARLEQMRNISWSNMLSATYLKDVVLAEAVAAGSGISDAEVKVRISPYNSTNVEAPSNIQPLVVKRTAGGATSIVQEGGNFSGVRLARVDVSVAWTGANGRARQRESSTIISNNGISKNYLLPMGNFAGGVFDQPENGGPVTTPTTSTPSTDDGSNTGTGTDTNTEGNTNNGGSNNNNGGGNGNNNGGGNGNGGGNEHGNNGTTGGVSGGVDTKPGNGNNK